MLCHKQPTSLSKAMVLKWPQISKVGPQKIIEPNKQGRGLGSLPPNGLSIMCNFSQFGVLYRSYCKKVMGNFNIRTTRMWDLESRLSFQFALLFLCY